MGPAALWGGTAASLLIAATAPLGGCSTGQAVAVAPVTAVSNAWPAPTQSPAYPMGVTEYAVSKRSPLPVLKGLTLSGTTLSTSTLRGHVVILTVWASWCEPCQAELPHVAAFAKAQDPATVRFVGLDERDSATAATELVRKADSGYPHLVDSGALLASLSAWLPDAVPGCLVVDRQGRVAARVVGQATADQLGALLSQVGVS